MSFDGSGVYSLTYTWATEAASPPIAISKLDTEMAGIATGLSLCMLRNGNGVPTANTPWNDKKITGLADATADTDALNRQTADARYALVSSGSFTASLRETNSGGTVLATGTAYWQKIGNTVVLRLPPMTGTSSATWIGVTGLPADIQIPALAGTDVSQVCRVWLNNNNTLVSGWAILYEGLSYMYFSADGAFTGSSGTKGLQGSNVLIYQISD